jgi:hypothetical protein
VGAESLAECRQDPRKAFLIAGTNSAVCLECGLLVRVLGPHLKRHAMKAKKYREKWGYNRETALACSALRQTHSARARADGRVHKMLAKCPPIEVRTARLIRARRRATKRLEYRLDVRDSKRGTPRPDIARQQIGEWIADATIARLRLEAKTIDQISTIVGLQRSAVLSRLRRIGFEPSEGFRRTRPSLFQHGTPVTGRIIRDVATDFKLTKKQLAGLLGVHYVQLSKISTGRFLNRPLGIRVATLVLRLRRHLNGEWRRTSPTKKGGRPPKLTVSERAALPVKHAALCADLELLRKWLCGRRSPQMPQLWNWLCLMSRCKSLKTLLFWPQFFTWIRCEYTNKGFLDATWRPKALAIEFLANDYDISYDTARLAVRSNKKII